jgi:hypothetical protein
MNIQNRLKKIEKQNSLSALCLCTISDLPHLLTATELAPVCERCGGRRTEKEIERFTERQIEGQKRLDAVIEQVRARNS